MIDRIYSSPIFTQRLSLGREVIMAKTKKAAKKAATATRKIAPRKLKKVTAPRAAAPQFRNNFVLVHKSPLIDLYKPESQVERLIKILGNNLLADIIGVSRSQPSMWKRNKESLSAESQRRISDLDHVMNRLLMELYPEQATEWLLGSNPHLRNARPADLMVMRGPSSILPAIDALATGSYA
jgi:hypothetical protein